MAVLPSHRLARGVLDFVRQQTNSALEYTVETEAILEEPDRLVCDGLIVNVRAKSMARRMSGLGIPVVNLSGRMNPLPFSSVISDDRATGRLAAEHLMAVGFKQFAFVGARETGYSLRCKDGFARPLLSAALPQYEMLIEEGRIGHSDVVTLLAQWIGGLPKPIGIMVDRDDHAPCVLEACRKADIAIPEQAALVSAGNNLSYCLGMVPALTSVDLNQERIGFEAAALMARLMAGEPAPVKPIVVEPRRVQLRQSSNVLATHDPVVAAASRFIREHAHESITIEDVARGVSISRRSLEAKYRKSVNRSPHEDLQLVRLERAKDLLDRPELSLAEIALKCGYNYPALMYRAFHKVLGMTPGEYRRNGCFEKIS